MATETGLNGRVLQVGGRNRYYLSLIIDPFIADYHEGLLRPVLEDVRRHTILGESLARINSMMRMQFPVSDVPEPDCYYKTMEVFCAIRRNTSRHIPRRSKTAAIGWTRSRSSAKPPGWTSRRLRC